MSEFFLYEIENIAKSGVEIKVTGTRLKKCDDDCIRTVRTVCFDFSEHDKVFEDKISQLEKDIASYKQAFEDKCADYGFISELLGKYQQENESLKQRIAELESEETEKTTKYTTVIIAKEINGQTYVTLDDFTFVVNALQAQIGT